VPVLIQIAGYNGPGPFAFALGVRPNDSLVVLESVPGVQINANGVNLATPLNGGITAIKISNVRSL